MKKFLPFILCIILFLGRYSLQAQNYCIPYSNCYFAPILSVVTSGGLSNLNVSNTGCSTNGYFNYPDLFVAVPSDTIDITIGITGLIYTGICLWIDWNNDGDFTDTNETIWNTITTASSVNTTFYVPSNVNIGSKRMRIRSNYYYVPSDPCSTQNYGETEDFTLIIVNPSGTDITMSSIDSPEVFKTGNNYIWIHYQNLSATTITKFDAGFSLDNNTPLTISNISTSLVPGESRWYKFSTPLSISSGGNHSLKVWVRNPNGIGPDVNVSNDTMLRYFCTGASGTYTIGSSGDFTSFNSALNFLKGCGIAGPIVFNILPGTYNEKVVIPYIIGMSAYNTIKFDGQDASKVTLTFYGITADNRATLVFAGCSYVTITNIKIVNTGNIHGVGVCFAQNSTYNTVSQCYIEVNGYNTQNFIGVLFSYNEDVSPPNTFINHHNLLYNCTISKGYIGAYLISGSSTQHGYYNKIIGNVFYSQYASGIELNSMFHTTIQYNTITGMKSSQSKGISSINYSSGTIIDGNIIHPGICGIYLNNENSLFSDSTIIINNIICNFINLYKQQGIYSLYDNALRIYHNSILVNGTQNDTTSAALCLWYSQNPEIYNNIFVSYDKNLLISLKTITSSNVKLDYNLYYYPGSTTRKFYLNGQSYLTLSSFKTNNTNFYYPHDINSYDQKNPHFLSSLDLHVSSSYPPYYGLKIWVKKDVDGDSRCPYASFLGADESLYQGPKPTAGFIYEDTVCQLSPVVFINKYTSADPVSHKWYVNGIYITDSINLIYTFPSNISNAVVMVISSNCYGSDTFSKTIVVRAAWIKPTAAFFSNRNIISPYDEIQFYDASYNCPVNWEWKITPEYFNDPYIGPMNTYYFVNFTNSYSQNPLIRFEVPGEYDVKLIVSNSKGADSIVKKKYIIVKPLQYMCQYAPSEVLLSPFGILSDDGGPQSDYANNVNCHIQLTPCVDTLRFIFYEFELSAGDYLKVYDGTGSNGIPLWDMNIFGANGLTGSLSNPKFPVNLTAASGKMFFHFTSNNSVVNKGFTGEWYGTLSQVSKPAAYFTGPDTGCVGVEVAFQNLSTGSDLFYEWDFEATGFAQSTQKDGIHVFNFAGIYPVKLKVKNCGGDSVFTKNITIISPTNPPTADFVANNQKPIKSIDIVNFTNLTKGCANSFKWEISPSSFTPISGFPNGVNPQIVFNELTCYTITLTASYGSSKDTITKTCYINPIDYCTPVVNTLNTDIGISGVKLGTINNNSSSGTKNYTDYSRDNYTYLDKYAYHLITITRSTNKNAMTRKVWIDWNIDGDFNDQGEEVLYEPSATTLSYTDTIRVPAYAQIGPTKMRIGVCISGFPNTPCGANLIGEFEDYKVIIRNYSLSPVVTLLGNDTVWIEQCKGYNDPGAIASSNLFGNMTSKIIKTDNIDWNYPGVYYINYAVKDSFGLTDDTTRIVVITPESIPPDVHLLGNNPDTTNIGFAYSDPGFMVYDSCSGIKDTLMTSNLNTNFPGKYFKTYMFTDMNGNSRLVSRNIIVLDRIPPVIKLKGKAVDSVRVFTTYIDSGAIATDNYDKTLTIQKYGFVNTSELGTYTFTYSVKDSSGNGPVTVSRTVVVYDDICPQFHALFKDQDTITVDVLTALSGLNIRVTDNYDSIVNFDSAGSYYQSFPDGIPRKLGYFTLIYHCSDQSGNQAYLNFVIRVVDRIKPVIKLKGSAILNICRYKTADTLDLLFTVTDNFDKNPVSWITGTYYKDYLPNRFIGLFKIVYHAKDASGNLADSVIRYINVDECGGMDDNDWNNLKIYPNPGKGKIYILLNDLAEKISGITVYNYLGQQMEIICEKESYNAVITVEIKDAEKGIYLLRIDSTNGFKIFKINIL